MNIVVDTHNHSISSGHAYSTVQEIAREAGANGMKGFVLTDHGPAMPGAPFLYHFANLRIIPDFIYGVKIYRGVEVNVQDCRGSLDLPEEYLKRMEFIIASLHEIVFEPAGHEENTQAMIKALENPYVDAIGHPGNPLFPVDIERVVKAAKVNNKLIEINNSSFRVRRGCYDNCKKFSELCKSYGVRIATGSDSHISFDAGNFEKVNEVIDGVGMPEELVITRSIESFENYLLERKKRIKALI